MSKLQESQLRGYKNLVAIAVIAVCVYFGFSPLFELVDGGVEGRVLGASFGAIFVLVLTMYLLNKQTEIEQESKRSEKIFEEKVAFYKALLATVKEILEDGKIDSNEVNKLSFSMIELQMLGADETIKAFIPVLDKCNHILRSTDDDSVEISDEDQVELLIDLSKFSQKCRVDLGIDNIELDAAIFESAVAEMTESVTQKVGNKEYFELDAKLDQLRELGYNEAGVESFRIVVSYLTEKSKNSDRYTVRLAKTGSSFNDGQAPGRAKQQMYLLNPMKKESGVTFHVGESTGVTNHIYSHVLNLLGKEASSNMILGGEYKGVKNNNLHFKAALADEMGIDRYHDLLKHIAASAFNGCEEREVN